MDKLHSECPQVSYDRTVLFIYLDDGCSPQLPVSAPMVSLQYTGSHTFSTRYSTGRVDRTSTVPQ